VRVVPSALEPFAAGYRTGSGLQVHASCGSDQDSDWFNWPSYSRLRGGGCYAYGGGCYAYQVDSANRSQIIVFRA
jgi:hypothetical protein